MKPRLDGADRPPNAFGYVLKGQIGPVVEDEDKAMIVVQRRHRTEDLIPLDKISERIPDRRERAGIVHGDEPNQSATAQPITADVDEDPIEPGLEAGGVAQRGSRPPGAQQGVLGRVFSLLSVAKDSSGEGWPRAAARCTAKNRPQSPSEQCTVPAGPPSPCARTPQGRTANSVIHQIRK